jgi:signal transduction histidine kinase
MEYDLAMSHIHYIHDLNNKIAILSTMLRCCKLGAIPPDEKINAVTDRINEIMTSLYQHLETKNTNEQTCYKCDKVEFLLVINTFILKLSKFFKMELNFTYDSESWEGQMVHINRELLYQVLENAIENSVNAFAKKIDLSLIKKNEYVVLELQDDGVGFKSPSERKSPRVIPRAMGKIIINENMERMNGKAVYKDLSPQGASVSLVFILAGG